MRTLIVGDTRQGCQFNFFEARFSNSGFFQTPLAILGNQNKPDKIWLLLPFFAVGKAWLWLNQWFSNVF